MKNYNSKIKILHLEDLASDAELVDRKLRTGKFSFEKLVVDSKIDFEKALQEYSPDIILSDHTLPNFDSLMALKMVKDAGIKIPFILITATISEEYAVEVMKLGAYDYILKDRLQRLPTAVLNAIEKNSIAKAHEESLKIIADNEKKFRHTLDNMIEGMQIHDFDWRYIYVNDALVSYSGYTREELMGCTMMEKYPGIEKTDLFQTLQRCMKERVAEHFESEFTFPDGRTAYFEMSVEPIEEGISIVSVDRTLQKKAADKILKINRLYSFISQINQSIVHIRDKDELISNACRIAWEVGKFKMVWMGMFDPTAKKIMLSCQHGIPDDEIGLFTEMPYQTNGPLDKVLSTGTYYVCNDTQKDLPLEDWKLFAAKHNINSGMVLPITNSGTIIGTFNLYATELNFFDSEEIELLVEVTGDISFALHIFEEEKMHKATQELMVQNENRFRTLIEKSSDIKTLTSVEGVLLYCSPSLTKFLGYDSEELLNKHLINLIHPEDTIDPKVMTALFKNPGKSINGHQRLLHKAGHWVWTEGSLTNMLHEPGINAFVSNFRDVTERKRLEEQRIFDNNNLDALINNTKDLMWSIDRDFNLITSNKPFDKSAVINFGRTIEKGENILSVSYTSEMRGHFKGLYERAFAGEAFTETEQFHLPAEIWVEISYYPIRKNNEVIGTACHSRDITEIKRGEARIKQSEARLKEAQALSHLGDWDLNYVTNKLFWSDEHCRIYGLSPKENIQTFESWLPFIHPEDLPNVMTLIDETPKKRRDSHLEYRIILKDGTIKHIVSKSKYKFDATGKPIGAYGVAQDVTERVQLEKAVYHEKQRFQDMFKHAPSCIGVLKGPDHEFEMANPLYLHVSGKRDIIGKTVKEVFPETVSQGFVEILDEVYKTGNPFSANEMLVKIDKENNGKLTDIYLDFIYQVYRNYENDVEGIFFFGIDVTEQVLARKKVEKSEARLKEAQAIGHIGNFEIDLVNNTEMDSDELYNICGIERDDVQPTADVFLSLVHPEDKDAYQGEVMLAYATLKNSSSDVRFIRKDGSVRYAFIERKFEFDETKKPIRLFGIVQDVTDKKIAELERIKITTDLIQRNKDLQQFAYIISHNLRAPVANIIGLAGILNAEHVSNSDKKTMIEHLVTSVKKLDEVIKDLNDILQVRNDISEVTEKVQFSEVVSDIQLSIENLVRYTGTTFICDFSAIDEIYTIKSYLYSIFMNLTTNSIKYRQPGIPALIEITSKKLGNKIILSFKDNGLGIDIEKQKENLFGLYKRFHFHCEGKGMGLYMVKTQVEAIGGKISIQSELNKGTEIRIEFDERLN